MDINGLNITSYNNKFKLLMKEWEDYCDIDKTMMPYRGSIPGGRGIKSYFYPHSSITKLLINTCANIINKKLYLYDNIIADDCSARLFGMFVFKFVNKVRKKHNLPPIKIYFICGSYTDTKGDNFENNIKIFLKKFDNSSILYLTEYIDSGASASIVCRLFREFNIKYKVGTFTISPWYKNIDILKDSMINLSNSKSKMGLFFWLINGSITKPFSGVVDKYDYNTLHSRSTIQLIYKSEKPKNAENKLQEKITTFNYFSRSMRNILFDLSNDVYKLINFNTV